MVADVSFAQIKVFSWLQLYSKLLHKEVVSNHCVSTNFKDRQVELEELISFCKTKYN